MKRTLILVAVAALLTGCGVAVREDVNSLAPGSTTTTDPQRGEVWAGKEFDPATADKQTLELMALAESFGPSPTGQDVTCQSHSTETCEGAAVAAEIDWTGVSTDVTDYLDAVKALGKEFDADEASGRQTDTLEAHKAASEAPPFEQLDPETQETIRRMNAQPKTFTAPGLQITDPVRWAEKQKARDQSLDGTEP
jgi:hypothetical protein